MKVNRDVRSIHKPLRRIGATALCLALGPLLVACGGGDDGSAAPASTPSESPAATGVDSGSAGPSSGSASGVTPAAGPKQTVGTPPVLSFRIPTGWSTDGDTSLGGGGIDLDDTTFQTTVIVSTFPNVGDPSLDSYTRTLVGETEGGAPGPDAEIAGEPARTVLSTTAKAREVQYVVLHDGQAVVAAFTFSKKRPQEEQDSIIASVLATWQWA